MKSPLAGNGTIDASPMSLAFGGRPVFLLAVHRIPWVVCLRMGWVFIRCFSFLTLLSTLFRREFIARQANGNTADAQRCFVPTVDTFIAPIVLATRVVD